MYGLEGHCLDLCCVIQYNQDTSSSLTRIQLSTGRQLQRTGDRGERGGGAIVVILYPLLQITPTLIYDRHQQWSLAYGSVSVTKPNNIILNIPPPRERFRFSQGIYLISLLNINSPFRDNKEKFARSKPAFQMFDWYTIIQCGQTVFLFEENRMIEQICDIYKYASFCIHGKFSCLAFLMFGLSVDRPGID